ncbi:MAG: hypothetical protein JWO27_1183 [Frankiales bacterium]|nr:hypothetical protein [Frankiales bacterium]MCW2706349.1 hypothetical protein [Frankiales bacterium]
MPLSEHEQRLLDQIERALYAEDPKFATTVRSTDLRTHMRRRIIRMVVLFVIGFVMMLVGVIVRVIPVSVIGFGVALLAMLLGANAYKRMNGGPALRTVDGPPRTSRKKQKSKSGGSAKDRLEERWRKRWEERGGSQ